MNSADPPPPDPALPTVPMLRPPGLGDRALSGFLLMVVQTIGVRIVKFGGHLALGWLLLPDDFGLFAISVTVHQFVSVLKNAGLRDILIQRHRRGRKWVNPAAWMSGALGLGGGLVLLGSAPLLAWFFDRPEVIPLILILALTTPIQSIGSVPMALLHAELRFKTAATLEFVNNTGLIVLTVLFAWLGLGAVSFVLPMLIVAIARTCYLWWLIRPVVRWNPQFRRWRYLVGDSTRLVGADVARTIVLQGDYIVLGRLFPGSASIGHYFYAFQFSIQSLGLFARNLDLVLLPALSKLQGDMQRHNRAFLRAIKTMAVAGIPICFLQAAVAEPAVRLLLPDRFHASIPYMVILSLGMAGQLIIGPSTSMLRSQGRFSVYSRLCWANAGVFIAAVFVGAKLGGVVWAAVAVASVATVFGFVYVRTALGTRAGRSMEALGVFAWPASLGAFACGVGWLVSTMLDGETFVGGLARIAVICLVALVIYAPLIRLAEPEAAKEITTRTRGLVRRLTEFGQRRHGGDARRAG